MPKVRVLGPVDDETRAALLELLAEAGLDVLDGIPISSEVEDGAGGVVDDETRPEPEGPHPATEETVSSTGEEPPADATPVAQPVECEEDAGIVVLSPACLEEGDFERVMHAAAARGCHVIGIWLSGTVAQELPRAFEDYGGDTVVWDADRLRDVVVRSRATPEWSLPDDRPRQERPVKRNKC